jgi:hypothetical protein
MGVLALWELDQGRSEATSGGLQCDEEWILMY